MRCRLLAVASLFSSAFLAVAFGSQTGDPLANPSQTVLLSRAADYVARFEHSMATVVLEERYVQLIKPWMLPPKKPDAEHLAWAEDLAKLKPDVIVLQRFQTRSDVLLVQLPNEKWTGFRDTFEVNGRLQRDREDRLRRLFLSRNEEESQRQLHRINEESSRWNLGGFYRNINLPTTGLSLLREEYQPKFAFRAEKIEEAEGYSCRTFSFKETSRPTLVQSLRGRDVPLNGQACVAADGTVWKTILNLDPRYTTRGMIETTYRKHETVDVLVPNRMWEWYLLPDPDERALPRFVETEAVYSNLRRFTVQTTEQVK